MALARTVVSLEKKLEKVTMKVKQADWHTYICKKSLSPCNYSKLKKKKSLPYKEIKN